jgi:hypothetical protein
MSTRTPTYTRAAFFDDVIRRLRAELPPELRDFEIRRYSYLVKLYYQNERVHFEVWVDNIRGQIEIGLDFEDGAESTAAYLAFFDRHIVEIKERTGHTLELERWTKTWGHLVEVYPIDPFVPDRAQMVAERMIVIMSTLQPLVEEAAIGAGDRRVSTSKPFWTRRKR